MSEMYRPKFLTVQDIRDGCIRLTNGDEEETRICVINEEFRQGFDFIEQFPRSVTMFGSARLPQSHPSSQLARRIAFRLAKELGFAVITGGGPGIMEAANHGANEAGGRSVGIDITLPHEQHTNPYVTDHIPFYFFFSRKVILAYTAEAYLYFPGGYGTLDEMSGILTLMQTGKIERRPLILVGSDFWNPLVKYFQEVYVEKYQTISPEDMKLFVVSDDDDEIIDIIKSVPTREKAPPDPGVEQGTPNLFFD